MFSDLLNVMLTDTMSMLQVMQHKTIALKFGALVILYYDRLSTYKSSSSTTVVAPTCTQHATKNKTNAFSPFYYHQFKNWFPCLLSVMQFLKRKRLTFREKTLHAHRLRE